MRTVRWRIVVALEVRVDEEGEVLRHIHERESLEGDDALELDVGRFGSTAYFVDLHHSFEGELDFGERADEFHLFVAVGFEVLRVGLEFTLTVAFCHDGHVAIGTSHEHGLGF